MLGDEITLTLNSPITDEQFDMLTDVDMENTPRIVFHTKNGKEVEYLKVVRCKYCEHWKREENYAGEIGDDYFCEFDQNKSYREDFFCADGERRRSE